MNKQVGHILVATMGLALAGCSRENPPALDPVQSSTPAALSGVSPSPEPVPEPEASAAAPVLADATYAPRDDCSKQSGWPAFHTALVAAIKARDSAAFAALAAPDIALDFGGGSGLPELKKRLNDPSAQLWQELDAILPLGCAIQGGMAAMPWVFWNVPEDVDSFTAMLVTGADVPLLDGPKGRKQGSVGWRIVGTETTAFQSDTPKTAATKVTLRDGRKGWVPTSKLRSLVDYRLIVVPKTDGWKITAFIAGD